MPDAPMPADKLSRDEIRRRILELARAGLVAPGVPFQPPLPGAIREADMVIVEGVPEDSLYFLGLAEGEDLPDGE